KQPEEAATHARMAQQIRAANRRRRAQRFLPEMPPLESVAQELPEFPEPQTSTWKSSLGEAPPKRENEPAEDTAPDRTWGPEVITVVSGLPRSGTSMMMQMLVAGGLEPLTDGVRVADQNNPKGYFEYEKIKRLHQENNWLADARGKVLKIVAPLVPALPQGEQYRVILMDRDVDEVLDSQGHMLERLETQGPEFDRERMKQLFQQQVQRAITLCKAHRVPILVISHSRALAHPAETAKEVAEFLNAPLDQPAMSQVIDRSLHRERR
ncbi:MAG: hypothetical protein RIS70_2028, partial [Planctomycetota bacterium]